MLSVGTITQNILSPEVVALVYNKPDMPLWINIVLYPSTPNNSSDMTLNPKDSN